MILECRQERSGLFCFARRHRQTEGIRRADLHPADGCALQVGECVHPFLLRKSGQSSGLCAGSADFLPEDSAENSIRDFRSIWYYLLRERLLFRPFRSICRPPLPTWSWSAFGSYTSTPVCALIRRLLVGAGLRCDRPGGAPLLSDQSVRHGAVHGL